MFNSSIRFGYEWAFALQSNHSELLKKIKQLFCYQGGQTIGPNIFQNLYITIILTLHVYIAKCQGGRVSTLSWRINIESMSHVKKLNEKRELNKI